MTPNVVYIVRVLLTGVAAAASSLLTSLPGLTGDDWLTAGLLGVVLGLGYAGIGAASTRIEPDIGRRSG